ncbi:carboxypeptidase-like regulatory domain-containing protein [Mucilaginibacter sp. E4BP6]|uniref:carboxypeptidase-like regulatory domain-containing protein n=1 Tax=Mucilaginibacter sp. E4BP6 TaxID=2723089 RepID=UPI0015CEB0F8|nr:carboxypeptidase-like regulatory domain-containing protein [Mucilaginibacter sp. E4BP6]NYE67302.1 hypothetical protein [Mucilaginibacter sp. E4BP6]
MNLYKFFFRLLLFILLTILSVIKTASAQMLFDNRGNGHLTETLSGDTDSNGLIVLTGKIISDKDNKPISYASISVPSGNCGTVADKDGDFYLKLSKVLLNDTIHISALGFRPKSFCVKNISIVLKYNPIITLNELDNQLKEVVISAKKINVRTLGNTSCSKSISVGFPLKALGSELGVRIALGKKTVLFRSFSFNISQTRLDTCTFRLNIYALHNGIPAENLLTQNILVGISKTGLYKIDLLPYKLLMQGDVAVSLEWVDGKSSTNVGAVFFSASLLSSCYHRENTGADWTRLKGIGAGFNLQVEDGD